MKIQMAILLGFLALYSSACAPAAPIQGTESPEAEPTQQATATSEGQVPSPAPPTETIPVVETAVMETQEEALSGTPTPTPSEWELVQQTVDSYRNRLDRSSDGYQGLTMALEQTEPNQAWCGGLNAAIGDFSYVNDEESAQALRDLKEEQGCD